MVEHPNSLSIIIPTHNRCSLLRACLRALDCQMLSAEVYEVVVVDDGSTDTTKSTIRCLQQALPLKIRYFRQESRGPAAARNLGILRALGDVLLFLGDDIIARPRLLEQHVEWHRRCPEDRVAVLGHVTWDPAVGVTPFMRWLENGGPQFNYPGIRGTRADYGHFYTCNLSVKKRFLLENGLFDEAFRHAAYEDTELAYRLYRRGLTLLYNPDARAYHRHRSTLRSTRGRMRVVGAAAALVESKHPELRFIGEFEEAVDRGPVRSRVWAALHELSDISPVPWISKRVAWRAHEYYHYELAREALSGYRHARATQFRSM